MARLLIIPLAVLCFAAALLLLLSAGLAASGSVPGLLADVKLAPVASSALMTAAASVCIAVPLGFAASLMLWPAAPIARAVALVLCALLLLAPAPFFAALRLAPPDLSFFAAVARGAALSLLVLTAGLSRIPATLAIAARAAGARPFQAWRHAVLAPLAWPLVGAIAVAFLAGLAKGPAAAVIAPHFDLARVWLVPAGLLVAALSVAALSVRRV